MSVTEKVRDRIMSIINSNRDKKLDSEKTRLREKQARLLKEKQLIIQQQQTDKLQREVDTMKNPNKEQSPNKKPRIKITRNRKYIIIGLIVSTIVYEVIVYVLHIGL